MCYFPHLFLFFSVLLILLLAPLPFFVLLLFIYHHLPHSPPLPPPPPSLSPPLPRCLNACCTPPRPTDDRHQRLPSFLPARPPNDNRASLLRSATQVKKPISERDVYMNLWRNYVVLACRVVPAITKTPIVRCASPDISLGWVQLSVVVLVFCRVVCVEAAF